MFLKGPILFSMILLPTEKKKTQLDSIYQEYCNRDKTRIYYHQERCRRSYTLNLHKIVPYFSKTRLLDWLIMLISIRRSGFFEIIYLIGTWRTRSKKSQKMEHSSH